MDREKEGGTMKRIAVLLIVLSLAVLLTACGSTTEAPAPAPEDTAETAAEPAEAAAETEGENVFADGVLTTDDVRFEITDWKVIPVGEKGNEYGDKPVIAFWYNVTNITGAQQVTPMASWIAMFQAYQDTDPNQVNELDVGMLPDEAFLTSQMEEIKPGGTAPCAVAYELDSDTVPVVLKAGALFGGSGYGEQTFDIAQ